VRLVMRSVRVLSLWRRAAAHFTQSAEAGVGILFLSFDAYVYVYVEDLHAREARARAGPTLAGRHRRARRCTNSGSQTCNNGISSSGNILCANCVPIESSPLLALFASFNRGQGEW
jgi:hypothetical protein